MDELKRKAALSTEELALTFPSNSADSTHSEELRVPGEMDQSHQYTCTIELGGTRLVDDLNAPFVAARPKPRGLLPVPREVEAAVAEDDSALLKEHGFTSSSDDRQRQVNSLTLQYYYGGHDVAYRIVPEGVVLLAHGLAEIRELVQRMSQEQLLTITIGQP
jgi:hypothetical protein